MRREKSKFARNKWPDFFIRKLSSVFRVNREVACGLFVALRSSADKANAIIKEKSWGYTRGLRSRNESRLYIASAAPPGAHRVDTIQFENSHLFLHAVYIFNLIFLAVSSVVGSGETSNGRDRNARSRASFSKTFRRCVVIFDPSRRTMFQFHILDSPPRMDRRPHAPRSPRTFGSADHRPLVKSFRVSLILRVFFLLPR